jgi:hypothetical protein
MARPWRFFCFALARELGMTVRQLLQTIDSRELTEWAAFFKVEDEKTNPKPKKQDVSEKIKGFFRGFKAKE